MQNLGSFGSAITVRIVIIYCFTAQGAKASKATVQSTFVIVHVGNKDTAALVYGSRGSFNTYLGSFGSQ
jgi:hypothetical protein